MDARTFESRSLINHLLWASQLYESQIINLYAVFKGPHAYAPWQPREDYLMRNSPEAALHTAEVWGPGAFAAHCIQLLLPDDGEFRTPWELFSHLDEIRYWRAESNSSTMCYCGDMVRIESNGKFTPHINKRTGAPCPPEGARLA